MFGLKVRPRPFKQLLSPALQPAGSTTQVAALLVDMNTLTSWMGLPTWIVKEDQGPSSPSLKCLSAENRNNRKRYRNVNCLEEMQARKEVETYQFCEGATDTGVAAAAAAELEDARGSSKP